MNTKSILLSACAGLILAGLAVADGGDSSHKILTGAGAVKWGAPPPVFAPGAQFALLEGDPAAKGGLVTVRLKLPAGYKIAPHWHPTDEHVTVLSGELSLGMGDTLDTAKGVALHAGGYAVAPANMHHYAWTQSGATIQVHLIGPFALTYVNPADDPSHK